MKTQKITAASALADMADPNRRQPHQGQRQLPPAGSYGHGRADDVICDMPPGQHRDTLSQAMTPFTGQHLLPTGQNITVSMNAPSPHLPFKDWMARGVVGGVGHATAWPFRLVAKTVESAVLGLVEIMKTVLKWTAIAVVIPAMLVIGLRIASHVHSAPTLETGTHGFMQDGRHALHGIGKGANDELTPETPETPSDGAPRIKRHHRAED